MEKAFEIRSIVAKHLKANHTEETASHDRLLSGLVFPSQNRLILACQIGKIWIDVFQLFGWRKPDTKTPRQVSLIAPGAAVVVQNNWKTSNFDSKQSKFKTLKDFKCNFPETEVVYGCINDFKVRDYYNRNDIHILTSNAFLEYMLGSSNWQFVIDTLREEIRRFVLENNFAK